MKTAYLAVVNSLDMTQRNPVTHARQTDGTEGELVMEWFHNTYVHTGGMIGAEVYEVCNGQSRLIKRAISSESILTRLRGRSILTVEQRARLAQLAEETAPPQHPTTAVVQPECDEAWVAEYMRRISQQATEQDAKDSRSAYLTIVVGYPTPDARVPSYARAHPYLDTRDASDTVALWQTEAGVRWVRQTLCVWQDNFRVLEEEQGQPDVMRQHVSSVPAAELRALYVLATRMMFGLMPTPFTPTSSAKAAEPTGPAWRRVEATPEEFQAGLEKSAADYTKGVQAVNDKPTEVQDCGHEPRQEAA